MQMMFCYILIYCEADGIALQEYLDKLSEWAHTWQLEFKCEELLNKPSPIFYIVTCWRILLSLRFHIRNILGSPLTRNCHGMNTFKESLAKQTKLMAFCLVTSTNVP